MLGINCRAGWSYQWKRMNSKKEGNLKAIDLREVLALWALDPSCPGWGPSSDKPQSSPQDTFIALTQPSRCSGPTLRTMYYCRATEAIVTPHPYPPGPAPRPPFSTACFCCLQTRKCLWGFPGGAVVGSPPTNAGDTGSSPGPGRSHMPRSNQACEPQLLKPTHPEPVLRNGGSRRNEKPAHRDKE